MTRQEFNNLTNDQIQLLADSIGFDTKGKLMIEIWDAIEERRIANKYNLRRDVDAAFKKATQG
jgi:hypothetical protein